LSQGITGQAAASQAVASDAAGGRAALRRVTSRYQAPVLSTSLWQLVSTVGPFVAICVVMYLSLGVSYWITLGLSLLGAGFVVRIFIIQHDCGHGAFFRSRRANNIVGTLCGLLTLTPYAHWRRQHAGHHAMWNNLDRRESGVDIYSTCLTVAEYRAQSGLQRVWYRFLRHPVVSLIALPPIIFLVLYRIPFDTPSDWRWERYSVYVTNAAVAGIVVALGLLLGFGPVALVQLPIIALASIIGVWLFSVQHRFEGVAWMRQADWRPDVAALRGSSYLRLPRVLQWFTGNIGFHHIHHLNPRIPNYHLERCHEAMADVPTLSLWGGLRAFRFSLWDEARETMVTFADARRLSRISER
jgi:omega-6 fatty acid desaturase (delta-12 desaturase)